MDYKIIVLKPEKLLDYGFVIEKKTKWNSDDIEITYRYEFFTKKNTLKCLLKVGEKNILSVLYTSSYSNEIAFFIAKLYKDGIIVFVKNDEEDRINKKIEKLEKELDKAKEQLKKINEN